MTKKDNHPDVEIQNVIDITQLINPFPGLRPFGIEESHLFFGREGQSDEVLVKLSNNKFVAILGASGSGKSSLMYCGLIPTLYGGFMTEVGSNWKIVVTRPGGGPIDNLAEALLIRNKEYANLSEEDKLIRRTIISTVLRSSSLGLVEVVKQLKADNHQNILILVDQFEEIFRYHKLESATLDLSESSTFVNLLVEAIHHDEPIYIALTMRSDFIGECAQYPDLTQMINDSHYLIPQMTRDQKRMAIEGPIAVGGGKIAPRLIQQLLNDVGDNPDQLPILQHALMRTWFYWTENRTTNESIDLRHYNAIGALREALSLHANETYDSLSGGEKGICEMMFKTLTEKGSENQGIRHPTKLSTIASIAGVSEDKVIRVVERFREVGRSLLMPPFGIRLESDTVIDISHESLMRIWIRLKRWLDEESKAAEMYLKLSEAAERYQERKAKLWQMPDLQLAINWREENKPTFVWGQRYNPAYERTMVFLETSEKAYRTEQRHKEFLQKRQVRRIRITAVMLAVAALVSLTFVIYANIKAQQARENEILAQNQVQIADQQREKAIDAAARATTQESRAKDEAEKARQARELAQQNENLARQQTAIAQEQQRIAEDQTRLAQTAQSEAQEQAQIAREQEQTAQQAKQEAEVARENTERLRYQTIAQSMAIKARTIVPEDRDQAELKMLVARQAYLFYEKYQEKGKEYNGDIYVGIYNALQGIYEIRAQEAGITNYLYAGDSALNYYHKPVPPNAANTKIGIRSVICSKDGKTFYSAGSNGEVLKWDVEKRTYKSIFKRSDVEVARVVNISQDEKYLALGTQDDNILIFNTRTFNTKNANDPTKISGHIGGTVFDLVFLPTNSGFISVGGDNRILISDFKTSKEIAVVPTRVKTLALSSNANILIGGSDDGNLYKWNLNRMEEGMTTIERKSKSPVTAVKFSKNEQFLAIGDNSGSIIYYDFLSKAQVGPNLTGFRAPVTDIEFSPDDRLLLATSKNKQVRIWDTKNINDLPTILTDYEGRNELGWVYDASFSHEGDYFLTAAGDGNIRKYPVNLRAMAEEICEHITLGNMNKQEWAQYVGVDIERQETCEGKRFRVQE